MMQPFWKITKYKQNTLYRKKMSISSAFVYFSDFEVFLFFATFLVLGNLFLGKTEKQYVP